VTLSERLDRVNYLVQQALAELDQCSAPDAIMLLALLEQALVVSRRLEKELSGHH